MEKEQFFLEKKNKLLEKTIENHYFLLDDVYSLALEFKLTEDEEKELWHTFFNTGCEPLKDYQLKARLIEDLDEKIAFCRYVLVCKILEHDVSVKDFSMHDVIPLYGILYDFLDNQLNDIERTIIKTYFGFDDGILLDNDEKTIEKIGCPINRYLRFRNSAFGKLNNKHLQKELLCMSSYIQIDEYRIVKGTSGNNEVLIFSPFSKGNDVSGPVIVQFLNKENGYTDIGYVTTPGTFDYTFTIYSEDGKSSAMIFYNQDNKPRPEIYFSEEYISFGVVYPKFGYHGNLYTFESKKNICVANYWEGSVAHTRGIPFHLDEVPSATFKIDRFVEGNTVIRRTAKDFYQEFITETQNHKKIFCRFGFFGEVIIGTLEDDEIDAATVLIDCQEKMFIANYEKGEIDKSLSLFVDLKKERYQLSLINKEQEQTFINYDPSNAFNVLKVVQNDKDGNEITSKLLSNPYLHKKIAPPASKKDDGKTSEEKLDSLIGLENVKKMIKRLKAYLIKNKNSGNSKLNLNMFFTGNPGTGKTEVARLVAGILYDNKIIKENKFIEVDRSKIVGQYIGQSEKNVEEIVKRSMGGVLFIDEAYSLYTSGDDEKDFGSKIIDALVKAMEDYRGQICFIFAGYEDKMNKLFTMNPGLASRIQRKIEFPNYTLDELRKILAKFLTEYGYTITKGAADEIISIMEAKMDSNDYSNARDLRNILESLFEIQAERTIDDEANRKVTIDDVIVYENENHIIKKKVTKIMPYKISLEDIEQSSERENNDFVFNQQYVQEISVNIKIFDRPFGNLLSEGSGFFITSDGLIGTCAHVIKDAPFIRVVSNIYTSNGKKVAKTYNAEIVGLNSDTDVGLLKISEPAGYEFPFYPLAKENEIPDLLSPVVMAGYPLGGERFKEITINEGKVQSINHDAYADVDAETKWIYLDISGCPGNSGSGVIDKNTGKCIGIYSGASLGHSNTETFALMRAIPMKYLWDLMKSINSKIKS